MKILITGAKGQLGQAAMEAFGCVHEVVGIDVDDLDITDEAAVKSKVAEVKPDWVIHIAAWTNVDEAARQPDAAQKVNGGGTRNLAKAVAVQGGSMLYISTNEVFPGDKREPYSEDDIPAPINPYGVSKLAGELAMQEELPLTRRIVARTSWLYGPTSTRNFPNKIIQVADERGSLKVVDDEVSTPTYVPDLVAALVKVLESEVRGVVHLVNEGSCSRYDWAKMVLDQTGRGDVPVEPIKLADFQRASSPPPHCILANTHAKEAGIVLPAWDESCREYLSGLGKVG